MQAITVKLPTDVVETIDDLAEEEGRTRSEVTSDIINKWLEQKQV